MRVTKLKLEKEEIDQIETLTDEITSANKDIVLAYDFSKDAYSLFKKKVNRRRSFKSFWQLFNDIRKQYTIYKLGNLMKNVDFYGRVRNFFRYFMFSSLFKELDKLDPMEALEAFLHMFQPPQQQQKQPQQDKGNEEEEKKEQQGQGQKKPEKSKQKDQKGLSGDEGNLPIDMTKFKEQMPKIEKILDSGLMDKEDLQDFLGKNAGIGHSEIKIENIVDLIDKISNNVSERELEIFYVARVKEVTERYRRDEILKSVPYPEDEMAIKTIDNFNEILKTIPTQYALDEEIFLQKLVKKELLVRDFQARRLKRQALYLLIDVSGSMRGAKNIYACGVALAFVRQAIDEGSTYYLRFFDHEPHKLFNIKTKKEAEKMMDVLVRQPFSGGGTNIEKAITTAVNDIIEAPEKFEKAEIMIISDGEDNVNLNKRDLKKIKLHSTIIDGKNDGLEMLSDTYIELSSSDLNID